MTRDSTATYIHLHHPHHADLHEDFLRTSTLLPHEPIPIPPQHQPPNPEDEDDVVPDQHAAFGIQRATQGGGREGAWRELGLEELVGRGPREGGSGGGGSGVGTRGLAAGSVPRRDEPVQLALRRRPGAGTTGVAIAGGGGGTQNGGGGAGNGLPR